MRWIVIFVSEFSLNIRILTYSRDYDIHIRVHVLHQFAYINHKCFILFRSRVHCMYGTHMFIFTKKTRLPKTKKLLLSDFLFLWNATYVHYFSIKTPKFIKLNVRVEFKWTQLYRSFTVVILLYTGRVSRTSFDRLIRRSCGIRNTLNSTIFKWRLIITNSVRYSGGCSSSIKRD